MSEFTSRDRPLITPEAGALAGGGAFAGVEAGQRTAGYYQELHQKLTDLPPINPSAHRNTGVRQAWQWEKLEVELGGKGTRAWTPAERAELIQNGKVEGYEMHHINSAKAHPDLAGHPDNLTAVKSGQEHLDRHGGSFRNETDGDLIPREQQVRDANWNRVFKGEMMTAIGVGAGAFMLGAFTSWVMDRNADWRTHAKRGLFSGGVAVVGYGITRGAGLIAEHVFKASASTVSNVMVGAGLGFGMLVTGIMAYRAGLRGWDLAKEVGWTGVSGLTTYLAAAIVKGALFGSAGGPVGMLVGAGVAIVVGFALEGVRRWWTRNNMTEKVGQWVGHGVEFLKDAGRSAISGIKEMGRAVANGVVTAAQALCDGAKAIGGAIADGARSVWEGAKSIVRSAGETIRSILSWRPRWS